VREEVGRAKVKHLDETGFRLGRGKWVELLKEIAPRTARVGLLFNPAGPPLQFFMPSIQAAALSFNVQVSAATVHAKDEIEAVIAAQARDPVGGLMLLPTR
jgi:putative ABC transport system substrate-binding protein